MHGYYQTDGFDENFDLFTNPRFDFAPGINYEPWFSRYQNCAIEDARLSQFLYSFRPDIKVGVLYPLATRWIEGPTEDLRLHSSFWNKNLSELGIQFIYINESQLIEAEISKNSLVIDGMTLDVLVLPDYRYFENNETIEKINEFVEANGAVVLSGRVGTQVNLESKNQQALFASSVLQVPISLDPSGLMTIFEPFLHNSFTFESDDNKPIWARVCKKENMYRVALLNDLSTSRRLSIQTHSNILIIRIFDCLTGDILSSTKSESDQYLSRIDILMTAGELVTIEIETIEPTQFGAYLAGHWQIESLGARIQRYGNVDLSNQTQFANVSHLKQDLVDFLLLEKGWFLQADSAHYEIDQVDVGWQELLPNWIGCGKYQLHVNHDGRNAGKRVYLMVPSLSGTALVILNGHEIDSIELNSATFDLGIVQELEAELEIHILSSAANRYYSGSDFQEKKQRNGILSIPRLLYFSEIESKGG